VVKLRWNFWDKPRTIVVRKVYPMEMELPSDKEFVELLNLGLMK
jgi:hypothetical protein